MYDIYSIRYILYNLYIQFSVRMLLYTATYCYICDVYYYIFTLVPLVEC